MSSLVGDENSKFVRWCPLGTRLAGVKKRGEGILEVNPHQMVCLLGFLCF